MKVFSVLIFFLLATTSHGSQVFSDGSCLSWRFAVETNNIKGWQTVPNECGEYMGNYMLGHQYRKDSKAVTDEAWRYVKSLKLPSDGRNIWVFDIDETSLSNLPFFAQHGFGTKPINITTAYEWVNKAKAPALPESLELYRKLLSLGIKVVFLTGRDEEFRNVTATNLKNVGYHTWEQLILRASSYPANATVQLYKPNERRKLEEINRYRIIGNIGDQWADILGIHPGNRTFKLPNPMYYAI
ncbi:acid phosphatase 1-like isoform X1 [Mangifera indica]|uniref:acid phosphatase 1-like isoform X1 n=1 Tax=Mangifera indica TaxID=29780 RepID=UPI001CF9AECD|nr:acid phosphatase 1-like isoform X1 [Mangifera indica]